MTDFTQYLNGNHAEPKVECSKCHEDISDLDYEYGENGDVICTYCHEDEQNQPRTIMVPVERMAYLANRIETLNRKARRLGLPEIQVTVSDEITKVEYYQTSGDYVVDELARVADCGFYQIPVVYIACREVTITTPEPIVVAGWEIVARIDHVSGGGAGNIVNTVPNRECPIEYRTADNTCEHCGHNRRRSNTYVLFNEQTGEYKQVGKTCLKDFLGHSPETLVFSASRLLRLERYFTEFEDYNFSGCNIDAVDFDRFLMVATILVETKGYHKASDAFQNIEATKYEAWDIVTNGKRWLDFGKEFNALDEATRTRLNGRVEKVKAWVSDISKDASNDYLHNVRTCADAGMVTDRTLGIIASVPMAVKRADRKASELASPAPASTFFGEVGKRVEVDVKVVYTATVRSFSEWGDPTLVKMVTPEGQKLTWFASNAPAWTDEDGDAREEFIRVKLTIKAHDMYNGEETTKVNRVTRVR